MTVKCLVSEGGYKFISKGKITIYAILIVLRGEAKFPIHPAIYEQIQEHLKRDDAFTNPEFLSAFEDSQQFLYEVMKKFSREFCSRYCKLGEVQCQ